MGQALVCLGHLGVLFGPNLQRGLAENLVLDVVGQSERAKILQVLPNIRDTRSRPIRPEQRLGSNLFEPRKILQQTLWEEFR